MIFNGFGLWGSHVVARCQAAPSLLEAFALDGRCLSESEKLLAQEAPHKAAMLEQLRHGVPMEQ